MSLRWWRWTAMVGSFARLIPVQRPLELEWCSRRHRRRRRSRLATGRCRHRRRRHGRRLERHLDVLRAGSFGASLVGHRFRGSTDFKL